MLRIEKKKLISILFIILILVNNFLPIMVYAEASESENTADTEEITTNYEIKDEEEWDVSKNGDGSVKAKWNLEDRSLTITGSGEMKDWEYSSSEDWHSTKYTKIIEKVIINNGIINIGNFAFLECYYLKSIEIPNSIISIGHYAFYECSSLESIVIPKNTKSIGNFAFIECISLTNIDVEENNNYYVSVEGVLYNKEKTNLICYPASKKEKNFIMTDSVTNLEDYAFYECNNLLSVEISNGVTSIGREVFGGCSNLENIRIPNSVVYIDVEAFFRCSRLESINVEEGNKYYANIDGILINKEQNEIVCYPAGKKENSYTISNNIKSIGEYAFYECINLQSIEIPNSVTNIDDGAFYSCVNLKNIEINPNVTSIGSDAFFDIRGPITCKVNSEAHKYAKDNGIIYILKDSSETEFLEHYQVKEDEEWDISEKGNGEVKAKWRAKDRSITITGKGSTRSWELSSIEDWHLNKYSDLIEKVIIENGVTIIGYGAFNGCINLESVKLADSLKTIGECAFLECSNLKTIEIPNSVTVIGTHAFYGCSKLTSINVEENNSRYVSIEGVLYNKDKTTLICYPRLKEGKSYTIPKSVLKIEEEPLKNLQSLININVEEENAEYISEEGVLYNKNRTTLICYPRLKEEKSYKISNSVNNIGKFAFNECNNLENVEIPSNVTSIEKCAFYGCYNLENIIISNNETSIGYDAFFACQGPFICNKNSEAHRYAESNEIGYVLYDASPKLGVIYSTTNPTNQDVTVTITANKEIQSITGWTLSRDKKTLTKTYSQNTEEEITVKDLVGNETKQKVTINNIVQINADINGDEKIDTGDVISLLRHIAQEKDANIASKHPTWKLGEEKILSGDINKNDKIDLGDVIIIQRYIAAKSSQEIANKHPEWLQLTK